MSTEPPPTWDDVGRLAVERLGIDVERVNWFSTYRVHHRVAGRFRRGAPSCSATRPTSTARSAARA